ncbi:glutamate-rich protein 6 isoform X1 [Arapaima gigas]
MLNQVWKQRPGCLNLPAILRIRPESQDRELDPQQLQLQPQHSMDLPDRCQFCGAASRPFHDLAMSSSSTDPGHFCCSQQEQLFKALAQERRLILRKMGLEGTVSLVSPPIKVDDFEGGVTHTDGCVQLEQRMDRDDSAVNLAILQQEGYSPMRKTITYQLSSLMPREDCWIVTQDSEMETDLQKTDDDPVGPETLGFGIIHQEAEFTQQYYPSGSKFLTLFQDGSAQVLYPSGHLALLVVTEQCKKKKICIVLDDRCPDPPIRALFHSSGRATCYHGNGNIWLSLDPSGGQCSDQRGARTRRWKWAERLRSPSTFRPLFLQLNRSVAVRVLGQDSMFVSFLAMGRQLKVSVGTCAQAQAFTEVVAPDDQLCCTPHLKTLRCATLSHMAAMSSEELFLYAARVAIQRAFERLLHCRYLPSGPWYRGTTAPHLLAHGVKLTALFAELTALCQRLPMADRDRAFVLRCLQDQL